jgi:hypothetical protein
MVYCSDLYYLGVYSAYSLACHARLSCFGLNFFISLCGNCCLHVRCFFFFFFFSFESLSPVVITFIFVKNCATMLSYISILDSDNAYTTACGQAQWQNQHLNCIYIFLCLG